MDLARPFIYFGARDYNPGTGRFLSEDPSGFGGADLNLYRYVFNNPVINADPSGRIPLLVPIAIASLIRTGFSIAIINDQTNRILSLDTQISNLTTRRNALQRQISSLGNSTCDQERKDRLRSQLLAQQELISSYQEERNSIRRDLRSSVAQALLLTILPLETSTVGEIADSIIDFFLD